MTMKRKSWQDYQKEIADDHYYYARSCIRQNFFPGSEKLFIDMLRNDLGKDLSDDPKHSSCTGIGYHSDIVPLETIMTVVARQFALGFPGYAEEVLLSILPIVAVFVLFQLLTRCYRRRQLLRTGVGFLYTVIGLILFLTGVNVGFTPVGNLLGSGLAGSAYRWVLIPIGALIGYYIVKAEPAVQVLNKQVEDVTGGTVSQSMMNTALSIGVACAVMLSMVRVLTGISIYWILVPGYALALILARYVPSVFVGIAFDSGGVASGPMTSTFLLPLAMGACTALGGNVVTDAFGVVAMVAMTPLVTIQLLGVSYKRRIKHVAPAAVAQVEEIIELA